MEQQGNKGKLPEYSQFEEFLSFLKNVPTAEMYFAKLKIFRYLDFYDIIHSWKSTFPAVIAFIYINRIITDFTWIYLNKRLNLYFK